MSEKHETRQVAWTLPVLNLTVSRRSAASIFIFKIFCDRNAHSSQEQQAVSLASLVATLETPMNTTSVDMPILKTSLAERIKSNSVYIAWFQALIATLGSLFFSEVMQLTPCVLCWYQRIMMYPLVLILTVGILLRDQRLRFYVLPLSAIGLVIAVYHNLLYYNIISESIAPCTAGISCTTRQIEWLGFITIPLMSLTAFIVITLSMVFYKQGEQIDDANETAQ